MRNATVYGVPKWRLLLTAWALLGAPVLVTLALVYVLFRPLVVFVFGTLAFVSATVGDTRNPWPRQHHTNGHITHPWTTPVVTRKPEWRHPWSDHYSHRPGTPAAR